MDRGGGEARTGRLAPPSEEPARGAAGSVGLELRELPARYEEDEISLVDLWLALVRRRFIFAAAVLACVLAGLLFAFLRPPTYAFTTTIQIGRIIGLLRLAETDRRITTNEALESPETVVAKLNEGYIPKALAKYINQADDRTPPEIQATSPKLSQLVLIESEASEKDSEFHLALHNNILALLLEDHGNLIDNHRKALELQVTQAQKKYESLSDETRVLTNRVKLLDDTQVLLEKQIGEVQGLISAAPSSLDRAQSEVGDESMALVFLMVGNAILQNQVRLAGLEERSQIGLPKERSTLAKGLADVKRYMAIQQQKISVLETQLLTIQETHVIVGPARSLEPVGPGRAVILALAGVFGVILGIFAAFFAEFMARVRVVAAERKSVSADRTAASGA